MGNSVVLRGGGRWVALVLFLGRRMCASVVCGGGKGGGG